MDVNKADLLAAIKGTLIHARNLALAAAEDAHSIATHKENIAENKYDTLGLEAAYLAHGQSQRVAESEAAIVAYNQLSPVVFNSDMPIAIGALIQIVDQNGLLQWLFLGPLSGGLSFIYREEMIRLITPSAPLGKALIGCFEGDEIQVKIAGKAVSYEIISIA